MAVDIKFTEEEIENSKEVFKKLSIQFEQNNELYLEFKARPISFLRRSGLLIMKYINNENERNFLNSFSWGIKRVFYHEGFFDPCSWCKLTALTIIYALCGKARLTLDAFWGILSSVIEALENILNISNEIASNLLSYLNSINEKLSPFRLARLVCQQIGYC